VLGGGRGDEHNIGGNGAGFACGACRVEATAQEIVTHVASRPAFLNASPKDAFVQRGMRT
jgi:hypothetical protein